MIGEKSFSSGHASGSWFTRSTDGVKPGLARNRAHQQFGNF